MQTHYWPKIYCDLCQVLEILDVAYIASNCVLAMQSLHLRKLWKGNHPLERSYSLGCCWIYSSLILELHPQRTDVSFGLCLVQWKDLKFVCLVYKSYCICSMSFSDGILLSPM